MFIERSIDRFRNTYRAYPSIYWVVISLELLERGAYYGIMGYFPVHLMRNLDFTGTQYGVLYALLMVLLYVVPLFSASLAKKIGYRTTLLIAFIVLIPTYFTMTFAGSYLFFFPLIIAWGIGAGAFKPMVSATIAHVTDREHRNSAYAIYYLSINWGSLLAMLGIGLLIPEAFAYIAFAVGGVLIILNLIITFIFYKDPIERSPDEKMTQVFTNIGMVLPDMKFTVLLLIYSGFFFIFSSMHTFLPVYYTEFGLKPAEWVEAPVISAINPFTIVLLGPFLSKFSDKFDALKLMIFGMLLFSAGLLILGMIPIWYALALGIFVYSIGEFLTHPNFISYVSRIAPEEKVAIYMGFAFLPSALGNVLGSVFGGVLWDSVAVGMESPSLFWGIYVGIGLFTIGNFLLYNRWASGRLALRTKTEGERKRNIWDSAFAPAGAYALVGLVVFAGFSGGTMEYKGSAEPKNEVLVYEEMFETSTFNGRAIEGSTSSHTVFISDRNVQFVNVTLTWRDEPDQGGIRGFTNTPDRLSLTLNMENMTSPLSDEGENDAGGSGSLSFSYSIEDAPEHLIGTGTWEISVSIGPDGAGDQRSRFGFFVISDDGNDYDLMVTYQYLVPNP